MHNHEHHHHHVEPKGNKVQTFLAAALLALACPGDDVATLTAAALSQNIPQEQGQILDPEQLLGMMWVHRQLEDHAESSTPEIIWDPVA